MDPLFDHFSNYALKSAFFSLLGHGFCDTNLHIFQSKTEQLGVGPKFSEVRGGFHQMLSAGGANP